MKSTFFFKCEEIFLLLKTTGLKLQNISAFAFSRMFVSRANIVRWRFILKIAQ